MKLNQFKIGQKVFIFEDDDSDGDFGTVTGISGDTVSIDWNSGGIAHHNDTLELEQINIYALKWICLEDIRSAVADNNFKDSVSEIQRVLGVESQDVLENHFYGINDREERWAKEPLERRILLMKSYVQAEWDFAAYDDRLQLVRVHTIEELLLPDAHHKYDYIAYTIQDIIDGNEKNILNIRVYDGGDEYGLIFIEHLKSGNYYAMFHNEQILSKNLRLCEQFMADRI